ncbi:MAG: 4-(cytidine 5'-diphospho)-2-C-methyl-D-erythritol kinase [Bacteroidales bacterium]
MIFFAPAKVNLGLRILHKRPDGFHELKSLMLPTGLQDLVEIQFDPGQAEPFRFTASGRAIPPGNGPNLVEKAWDLFRQERDLPPVRMHLHKQIPVGAGLGGGSSDASTVLRGLNEMTGNPLAMSTLHRMAEQLGSDCPFFLHNKPMFMEGRGERLRDIAFPHVSFHLVILFPELHIATAEAYARIKPSEKGKNLEDLLKLPPETWREHILNDFEEALFPDHPELEGWKNQLYEAGALYASMSGSGSALFGLFPRRPDLPAPLRDILVWQG